jgi:hypothetical protein
MGGKVQGEAGKLKESREVDVTGRCGSGRMHTGMTPGPIAEPRSRIVSEDRGCQRWLETCTCQQETGWSWK